MFQNEWTSDLGATELQGKKRAQKLLLDKAAWKLDMGVGRKE